MNRKIIRDKVFNKIIEREDNKRDWDEILSSEKKELFNHIYDELLSEFERELNELRVRLRDKIYGSCEYAFYQSTNHLTSIMSKCSKNKKKFIKMYDKQNELKRRFHNIFRNHFSEEFDICKSNLFEYKVSVNIGEGD